MLVNDRLLPILGLHNCYLCIRCAFTLIIESIANCGLCLSRGVFTKIQRMPNDYCFPGKLNAVPTAKITLGTPFPGVPAGNDP